MRNDLARWHFVLGSHDVKVPPVALVALIPFVCGMVTGITVAYIGTSFPIVLGLLGDAPATGSFLATIVLAYACGFLGMMLSPIHICLVVTAEHFDSRLFRTLAGLLKPAAVVLAVAVGMHLALARFWPA